MKRVRTMLLSLGMLLAVAMICVCLLPAEAHAAEVTASGTCGSNVTWSLDSEGTLTISGTGAMKDYTTDRLVPWYSNMYSVCSVIIGDGVTSIGSYAFYGCTNVASITIPDSVTRIGNHVFYGRSNLTSVKIPDSVISIGNSAFSDCSSLTSVTIGNSVSSIGSHAFYRCINLKSVTIPDSVTSIGDYTFYGCKRLTSVMIGNGVTNIGASAFSECTSLTKVTIPDSVTSIGNCAFQYTMLTSVKIPDSVTSIGNYAFSRCSLTDVTVGNSVNSIGRRAFYFCTSLTKIDIPNSVTSIGDSAFSGCTRLTGIWVDESNPNYASDEKGVLFNKDMTLLIQVPGALSGEYTVPDSVTSIGNDAFYGCDQLTSMTIPDSVTTIGDWAFGDFTCLTNLTYCGTSEEWSAINIGNGNNKLTQATRQYHNIENGVCSICGYVMTYTVVFKDWDGTVISSNTYHYGDGVTVPVNPYRGPDDEGYIYIFDGWSPQPTGCTGDATYIAQYTRHENVGLLYTIENGEVTITGYHGDSRVLRIPETIEGYPVTKIADCAFEHRSDITTVFIPVTVTKIGSYAFSYECWPVGFYAGTQEQWETIDIGSINSFRGMHVGYTEAVFGEQDCYYCPHCDEYLFEDGTHTPAYVYFYNWDGTLLTKIPVYYKEDKLDVWNNRLALQQPDAEREMDDMYIYHLKMNVWYDALQNTPGDTITGSIHLTAEYTATLRTYKVTFQNDNGNVLSSQYYTWGEEIVAPTTAWKDSPEPYAYTYVFAGWDKEVVPCAGEVVYVATYNKEYVDYTVRFWLDDQLLSEETYHWGDTIVLPADPQKEADRLYTYIFAGWRERTASDCEENWTFRGYTDYYAVFSSEPVLYDAIWKDWDGMVLHQDTFVFGGIPDSSPEDPVRAPDNAYTYTFSGWVYNEDENGNKIYTAEYSREQRWYQISFVDWNGESLGVQECYWGDQIIPPVPYRPADELYTYTFVGWDQQIVPCEGNATYTAVYSREPIAPAEYTVIFKNEDGTIISQTTYLEGETVIVPAAPTKESDNVYSYAFAGWDLEVVTTCSGNATYTATYTSTYIDYTVVFKNWDGTVLSTKTYHWGAKVTAPQKVSRAADEMYTYSFNGWDQTVVACAGDATYTATYTSTYINYRVVFKDWDGTVLSTKTYHYGDTVTAPANPTRPDDGVYSYSFIGWDQEIVVCNGSATYTAVYKSSTITQVPETITSPNYEIADGTISKISTSTTVAELLENINESDYVKVYKGEQEVTADSAIGTGMVVKIMDGDTEVTSVTVIVTGDTNGDGKITVTDYVQMKSHLLEKNTFEGAAAKAADTNGDGKTTVTDYVQMKAHILGKSTIQPQGTATAPANASAPVSRSAVPVAQEPVAAGCCAQVNAIVPDKRILITV